MSENFTQEDLDKIVDVVRKQHHVPRTSPPADPPDVRVPSSQPIKDSGERRQFATGAVRDIIANKPRPELISPIAMRRLALHLAKGAAKYSDRNWEKGIPLSQIMGSMERHILAIKDHMTDEDHCGALLCNAMFYVHTEEMIRRGMLPIELDDMPDYRGGSNGTI